MLLVSNRIAVPQVTAPVAYAPSSNYPSASSTSTLANSFTSNSSLLSTAILQLYTAFTPRRTLEMQASAVVLLFQWPTLLLRVTWLRASVVSTQMSSSTRASIS